MNSIRNVLAAVFIVGLSATAHATALGAARSTATKNPGAVKRYLMQASTTIYAGGMVMLNNLGTAEPAAQATDAKQVVGVAIETKTSASTGSYYIQAQEGWFLMAGATLAQTDQGSLVYVDDDATVDNDIDSNTVIAGRLVEYVGASSGWVEIRPLLGNTERSLSDTIAASVTLNQSDCGRTFYVTAAFDAGIITLPEASTVLGCTFEFVYIGADGGALLDITPLDTDADGIEGSCVLAASVVTFSGTADADIGLTKATILTGDGLKVTAVGAAMYWAHDVTGICANN